jgi:hypothetical protein
MCDAYNRWLGDVLSGQERLKWVGVANLDDVPAAVHQVKEAKNLGAVGMMILGTVGDRLLDDDSLLPFYETVASENLPLAVHVGWACPSLNNLYTHIYPSGVIPFLMPVLMGLVSMMSGGILDRFVNLRVVYLEAGCLWVHFILERLHHRFQHSGKNLVNVVSRTAPIQKLAPMDYIKRGNLYFSSTASFCSHPTCPTATVNGSPLKCSWTEAIYARPPRQKYSNRIRQSFTACRVSKGPTILPADGSRRVGLGDRAGKSL